MKRFKNILVVCADTEATDAALMRAVWLAGANRARVTLIDAVEARPEDLAHALSPLSDQRAREIAEQIEQFYADRLDRFAVLFRDAGIEVSTHVAHGVGFIEIIRTVLSGGHDLVIKGAQPGAGGVGIFAGIDMHLMRKCPCPVWMLHPDQPESAERIAAAVDPDPPGNTGTALNRVVLELATSLADRDHAEVHVVAAWRLREERAMRSGRFTMSEPEIQKILDAERRLCEGRLEEMLEPFAAYRDRMGVTLEKGFAGEVIPEYARIHGIDTVVMGTVGRTGIRGYFIGNTAETILNAVDCSVLTIKPPGFESPVTLET